MIPRRRYRGLRMAFLRLILQQLLLVEDKAAAHHPTAVATTGGADIGQGPYAAAAGWPPFPPHNLVFSDSSTEGQLHGIPSERHPHPPAPSPSPPPPATPYMAEHEADGSRSRRRRDHPPPTLKRNPPDISFQGNSDGHQRGLTTAEAASPSTLKRISTDNSF
ncbi:unnamed protein product, partial [Laminaria digitata]